MSIEAPIAVSPWRFYHFGLLVTGRGENKFLPFLFRALTVTGRCHFYVIRKVEQLRPVRPGSKQSRKLSTVGSKAKLPTRDQELGLIARAELESRRCSYVILVDDLEHSSSEEAPAVFSRYRTALDTILGPKGLSGRASVHFLTNMLEAYYFAHAAAINAVLGLALVDFPGDVESIRHPKSELKRLAKSAGRSFDEIADGAQIARCLDVPHVLARPETCAGLRSLFGWCCRALDEVVGADFCLESGIYSIVTGPQIGAL